MRTIIPGATHSPLLVVEDNDEDFESLRWALRKIGVDRPVRRCVGGGDLLDYLHRSASRTARAYDSDAPQWPALILLDLNLGADDGREVLAAIKADDGLRHIPVVVWSTSTHHADVETCYRRGASGYAAKPVDSDRMMHTLRIITSYWLDCVTLPSARPPGRAVPAGGVAGRAILWE